MTDIDVVLWVSRGEPLPTLSYGTRLAERLRAYDLRIRAVPYMKRPLTPEEINAPYHLLSGGEVPVHSNERGMVDALRALGQVLDRTMALPTDQPGQVIGTCLGMQMIVAALSTPAMVIEPAQPINVGMEPVFGISDQPLPMAMFHYHRVDPAFASVATLNTVYTTADNPITGFRLGRRVTAYQGHPELSPNDMRLLIAHNKATIEEYGATTEAALAQLDQWGDDWHVGLTDQLLIKPFLNPAQEQ